MKRLHWILITAALVFFAACASTPEEPSTTNEPAPAPAVKKEVSNPQALEEAKKSADEAKAAAIEKKADKAAASEFNEAQKLYERAASTADDQQAADLYNKAAAAFKKSELVAEEARAAALRAINDAKEAIKDTEMKAEEAKKAAEEEN